MTTLYLAVLSREITFLNHLPTSKSSETTLLFRPFLKKIHFNCHSSSYSFFFFIPPGEF